MEPPAKSSLQRRAALIPAMPLKSLLNVREAIPEVRGYFLPV